MDPPLEPPLRVRFHADPQRVGLSAAQLELQRFIDEAKNGPMGGGGGADDAAVTASMVAGTRGGGGARGTSAIVLGQLQRLSDSLVREQPQPQPQR